MAHQFKVDLQLLKISYFKNFDFWKYLLYFHNLSASLENLSALYLVANLKIRFHFSYHMIFKFYYSAASASGGEEEGGIRGGGAEGCIR